MLPVTFRTRSGCYKWMQLFILSSTVFFGACENLQVATTADESDGIKKIRTGRFELIEKTELAQLKKDAEVVPGLLSAGHIKESFDGLRSRTDAIGGDGKASHDSDDRCLHSDLRSSLLNPAALYPTRSRPAAFTSSPATGTSIATASPYHDRHTSGADHRRFVVKTLR